MCCALCVCVCVFVVVDDDEGPIAMGLCLKTTPAAVALAANLPCFSGVAAAAFLAPDLLFNDTLVIVATISSRLRKSRTCVCCAFAREGFGSRFGPSEYALC